MAIRISHQGAPAASGMAAYTAGRNKSRQRQKKDALDMWQQERQQSANIYRRSMGRSRPRQSGQLATQQQGTWTDPLESAVAGENPHDAVQIKAQRKANDRAARQGKPKPYPQAEGIFHPAPTKKEIADDVYDRNKKDKAEGIANQLTLDTKKDLFEDLKEDFDAIDPGDPEAWADTGRREAYKAIKNALNTGEQDQKGDKTFKPLEYYEAGIAKMNEFLNGHKSAHLIPRDQRKGNTRIDEEQGIKYRKKEDGTEEFNGFVYIPGITLAQIDAGDSKNYRKTPFGYEQRVMGKDGIGWEPIEVPKAEETASAGEQYNEWGAKWAKAYKNYIADRNINVDDPEYEKRIKEARAFAFKMFPRPPEGGGSPASGGGSPASPAASQPTLGPITPDAAAAAKQQQDAGVVAGMNQGIDDLVAGAFPGMPQPKSPEEVSKLPPGSLFLPPNGMPKRVPGGAGPPAQEYGPEQQQQTDAPAQTPAAVAEQRKGWGEDWSEQVPVDVEKTPPPPAKQAKGRNTTGDPKNRKPISEQTPEERATAKTKRQAQFKRYQEIRSRQKKRQAENKFAKGTRQDRTAERIAKKEQETADRIAKKKRRTDV